MAVAVAQMSSLHSLRVALMAELFTKLVNVFASNCKPVFIKKNIILETKLQRTVLEQRSVLSCEHPQRSGEVMSITCDTFLKLVNHSLCNWLAKGKHLIGQLCEGDIQ